MNNHDRKAAIAAWLEKPKRYKRTVFFDEGGYITMIVTRIVGGIEYRWSDSIAFWSMCDGNVAWRKQIAWSIRRVRDRLRLHIENQRLTKPTMPG